MCIRDRYQTAMDVVAHAGQANPITIVIALGCIFVLWAVKRWAPTAPGALALVVVCTALAYVLGLDARGVNVLGPVTGGWPQLSLPSMHLSLIHISEPTRL